MEIKIYGAKRFGNEIIVFEEVEETSKCSEYDYIVIQNRRPDGRGNGGYDMKILHGDQSELSLPKGWKISELWGGWNWQGKSITMNISDQYEIKREFYIPFSNSDSLEELALEVLKKIIYITENFENSLELLLVEGRDSDYRKISFSFCKTEGNVKDFENNKEKVLKYWSLYSQFISNPIYRRNISSEHLKLINEQTFNIVNRLIDFKFTIEE